MSFADTYLARYASGFDGVLPPVNPDVSFIAVVPVFHEDGLKPFVTSLAKAAGQNICGEVILVANYPEHSRPYILREHQESMADIKNFIGELVNSGLTVWIANVGELPAAKAGPGLARKIGMDIAVSRFNELDKGRGVLISLDADTLPEPGFFDTIHDFFLTHKVNTCVGYFEHLRSFNGTPVPDLEAMMVYELYMRMVRLGLEWAGYPHAFHSLGSNFSVTAKTYVRAGGMGVQQSGEDFYFLNKCVPLGRFFENSHIRVYPAGRKSDRVLFGTGPFIRDYRDRYPEGFKKYSWQAIDSLSNYLGLIQDIEISHSRQEISERLKSADNPVAQMLGWRDRILRAHDRAGDSTSLRKWIWRELDGLQMVRYLNEHQKIVPPVSIRQTAGSIARKWGYDGCIQHVSLILQALRKTERERGITRIS